jgi:serine/threonine-protein kinase
MGSVYRARDERLGRQVALKILAPYPGRDESFERRFFREARAAAAVDHPNIIPVYEAAADAGLLFIAMRYVRGGDVQSLLNREGPLSPERTMVIIAPVASALDEAHAAGLVHRDVKPGNILLDSRPSGRSHVYLTDFGVTTFIADPGKDTITGEVIGTPAYMAPEQFEGRSVDGRTDQYGLACSAFTMLSGSPPYKADTLPALIMAVVRGQSPPSLASRRPDLPTAVDAVFARALAKSPGDRFGTCGQFAGALNAALGLAPSAALSGTPGGAPEAAQFSDEVYRRSLDIPLKQTFRYVHEPSRASDDALASLGNDALMADLESRIRHSRGGTFLITGFRGVGKTTLVMRALDDLVTRNGSSDVILPVSLSVARSTTTERLLFAIVRRIFETLGDSGVLERLPPQTRHALLVAYMRTSLSFKETQSKSSQRSAGLDLGLGPGKLVKAVADIAAPKVSLSASRSQSLATEAAFLAYSETDAEYDLMRIISLVDRALDTATIRRGKRWLLPRWRRPESPAEPRRLHLVIVLDEVDKLTIDDQGMAAVEELLSGIKNVLTMPGAHFLVVAGPDLQDRAVRDAARGSGVYESVFGWRLYVPCMWDAPERLLADIVGEGGSYAADVLETLGHYLRFKARGVPRRLLQEINGFVVWDGDQPRLRIGARDLERVEFYARMERILRGYTEGNGRARLFPVAIDEDRWRLGNYFAVDWVLQSEGEPFTAADLLREGEETRFDPLLRISRRSIDRLLDHLAQHEILEVIREKSASNTLIGDVAESAEKVYSLSAEIRHLLYGFAVRRETERAARDVELSAPRGRMWAVSSPGLDLDLATYRAPRRRRVIGGRYELGELISQGALSSVFKGRDAATDRQVVVKLLLPALAEDPVALARFRREAEITRKLNHAQVVRAYDFLDGPDDHAIILEQLPGPTLGDLVLDEGPMPPDEVAGLGQVLSDALTYLAAEDVVRLDLKPGNIVMTNRGPVIIDLGIAFQPTAGAELTAAGQFIGTPAFSAPEVITGREPDSRADIYALGMVMYYCLAGRNPWEDMTNPLSVMYAVLHERLDLSGLEISEPFRAVLEKAIARDPEDRFANAAALRDALRQTPEWRASDRPSGASGAPRAAGSADERDVRAVDLPEGEPAQRQPPAVPPPTARRGRAGRRTTGEGPNLPPILRLTGDGAGQPRIVDMTTEILGHLLRRPCVG